MSDLRILALGAQSPRSSSFRIRVMQLIEPLAELGIEIRPLPLFTEEDESRFRSARAPSKAGILLAARRRLLSHLQSADDAEVALIQRQADLLPSLRAEREAARGRRLVFDLDDAIWLDAKGASGHPLAFLKGTRRKVRWLGDRADRIVAANPVLASHFAGAAAPVTVIPSLVDPANIPLRQHREVGELVVGWIGSPPTSGYLNALARRLERLAAAFGGQVRLLVVGGEAPAVRGVSVESRPWSEETESAALLEIDVGVMPLPDSPWTRGKSAYKALLYMAAGVPVIADDVGIVRRTVGEGGRVVDSDDGWFAALSELANAPELRAKVGAAGRARAEQHYSLRRWAPVMAAMLRGEDPG